MNCCSRNITKPSNVHGWDRCNLFGVLYCGKCVLSQLNAHQPVVRFITLVFQIAYIVVLPTNQFCIDIQGQPWCFHENGHPNSLCQRESVRRDCGKELYNRIVTVQRVAPS